MAKAMTVDEVEVTEAILFVLTDRRNCGDGNMEIDFSDPRNPGMLRGPGTCSARVLSEDPEESGLYEVTVSVRKISS